MRRFLVVGCGGSGGATLAYLMDQLRSDLAAAGVHALPRGWQFLHVDVPSGEERGPRGMGNVVAQGGSYLGSGPQGSSYHAMDLALSQRLGAAQQLDTIATWAARTPEQVATPISTGAGQYRAVGRMITLNKAGEIRAELERCWNELFRVETTTEMRALDVPGLGTFDAQEAPIVLVVSSMAGGAGASMALDVCRLLTLVPGLDPKLMGVFMVTADIFDSLPEAARIGVRANALAMLGEIVASQTGAARAHDVDTLKALGHHNGDGEPIPFARVFPVGRFVGADRTLFGDGSADAVYRGLGRGLSGLLMSGQATSQFVSYDLGNTGSPAGDRDHLGWGTGWDPLPWGSYGFASLSMGRERYAEYSAQCLARASVDTLVEGHLQPGNQASSSEQVTALLDSQWAGVCARLELPAPGPQGPMSAAWLTQQAFPRHEVDQAARYVVETQLLGHVPAADGMQAGQWLPTVRQRVATRRAALTSASGDAAYRWAFRWQDALLARVEGEVEPAIARFGLPYATAMLERIGTHLRDAVIPLTQNLAQYAPADVSALPAEVEQLVGGMNGVIVNGGQIVERMLASYRVEISKQVYSHAAGLVEQVCAGFLTDVLGPLLAATGEAQRVLETARTAAVTDVGLARLATDQYAAWPADSDPKVAARFDEADNEVLLTTSSQFRAQYEVDLPRAVALDPGARGFAMARPRAVEAVISGYWPTASGFRPPRGLLEETAPWRSRVFSTDPETGETVVPSRASFDVHVRPAEVLARARMFVARDGESFHTFTKLSLRDYVRGVGAAESELRQRQRDIASKFGEALSLARPLTSVDSRALGAVHDGRSLEYRYKFSAVPFLGLPVADDLRATLRDDPRIDQPSSDNLGSSMSDLDGVSRVDIFGSYPNYSPLVFDAVLKPVAQQWSQTSAAGRESFWRMRRSRPLNAALPMGDDERRTMVGGWFLGQLTGTLRLPEPPYSDPVEVWDAAHGTWLGFPNPLLTPPQKFTATYDWLPAVLESSLLAIARSHESPPMSSLRPYRVLRELFDASTQDPASGIIEISARRTLVDWLAEGRTPSGVPSRVPGVAAATTVDERVAAATAWLGSIRDLAGHHFMAPGRGAPGGGSFSVISTRAHASQTPIFRDLAPDVHWATQRLVALLEEARAAALATPSTPGQAATPPGSPTHVAIPEGGTF